MAATRSDNVPFLMTVRNHLPSDDFPLPSFLFVYFSISTSHKLSASFSNFLPASNDSFALVLPSTSGGGVLSYQTLVSDPSPSLPSSEALFDAAEAEEEDDDDDDDDDDEDVYLSVVSSASPNVIFLPANFAGATTAGGFLTSRRPYEEEEASKLGRRGRPPVVVGTEVLFPPFCEGCCCCCCCFFFLSFFCFCSNMS